MRTFFGGTFVDKELLEESDIEYPIKLEYYKQINEDEMNSNPKAKYGIEIVQTEYVPDNLKVKTKCLKYITSDERVENKILNIFKENQVTPIGSEDILTELMLDHLQNILN